MKGSNLSGGRRSVSFALGDNSSNQRLESALPSRAGAGRSFGADSERDNNKNLAPASSGSYFNVAGMFSDSEDEDDKDLDAEKERQSAPPSS